jgi:hypothetical protein
MRRRASFVSDRSLASRAGSFAVGLSLGLLSIVFAATGVALDEVPVDEEAPLDRAATFRVLDADGDGALSLEEAAANAEVAANFEQADRDSDGKLSPEEFEHIALNRSDQPGKFRNPDRG